MRSQLDFGGVELIEFPSVFFSRVENGESDKFGWNLKL